MKYTFTVLIVLLPLLCQSQIISNNNTFNRNFHSSINTSGGDISGEEGSISYSIGQVNYLSYSENSLYIAEGVQQPLIISISPVEITEDKKVINMAAYPNPTTNYFKIEASTYIGQSLKYHLTDLNGNFIEEGRIEDPGTTVDISGLAVAVYLLHVTNGSEHIKTFKIIKK